MKMPTRPWYPPVELRPDIFGLHHVTLLETACESDAARRKPLVEGGVRGVQPPSATSASRSACAFQHVLPAHSRPEDGARSLPVARISNAL